MSTISDPVSAPKSGSIPILAVDGPSGSGKGTICRNIALQLGWNILDSGALYRLVGSDDLC